MIEFCNVMVEIIKFLGYSLIGWLAGYNFCKMRRDVREIKEAVVDEKGHVNTENYKGPDRRAKTITHRFGTDWQSRMIGIVVILLSIFTVAQSVYFSEQNRDNAAQDRAIAECQAKFNDDFAAVLTMRAQWADEDKQALNKMLASLLTAAPGQGRTILSKYIETTDRTDKLRKDNPLPNLAARKCEGKKS